MVLISSFTQEGHTHFWVPVKEGDKHEETEWHERKKLSCWVEQLFHSGEEIYTFEEGRLWTEQYPFQCVSSLIPLLGLKFPEG